ncbi:DNA-directed RNA polymerase III subunit RPC10 [Pseudohyphozyma bogoriensis]|nr:DNA-directed RNA polymerase III subunit RPC10 [Pseudohyphozyma bogoriensis]
MIFCPYCANMLGISPATGANKWSCKTCPYEYPIKGDYTERTHLSRKEVDDVLGGEDSWKNVDSIAVDCKKECGSDRAHYMQLQIHEPMTTFYRCANPKCAYQWREN